MINIKNLEISFDEKKVIDGIDFEVPGGDSFVLLGKNGSGKSVILKAIAGLIDHYKGTIEINHRDIRELYFNKDKSRYDISGDMKLAYVFQKGGLFDSMNVFDNVAFGLRQLGEEGSSVKQKVSSSLARVGLSGSENKLPSELSGGMQKRVGLARAICLNPGIILFDDPTAGLDPILSDSISDLMQEIKKSLYTTSVVVTHDLEVARKVADTIALLYQGRIVFHGTADEFFSESSSYTRQFIEGDIEGPIDIF